MKHWILFPLFFLTASVADAAESEQYADLPARETVAAWLSSDAIVREAEGGRTVAGHEAGMLRASPNEWTVTATGQRRHFESGGTSHEWNAGMERTIRLPGKKALDTDLGEQTITVAQARYADATRQALGELLQLWLNWCAAAEERRLAEGQGEIAVANRDAVEKRVRAGDASKLELNLAEADLADVERLQSEARTRESEKRVRLSARFGDIPPEAPVLSEPVELAESTETLESRLIEHSAILQIAAAEQSFAELAVERERAERVPDPTLGAFSASEAYNTERLVGLSISVPLPGEYRSQKLGRALGLRDRSEAIVARERQTVEAESAARIVELRGTLESWQLARRAAERSEENARLTQRAYSLGEADLQTLLLARRQLLGAQQTTVAAQASAVAARYRLQLDSGVLWADLTPASLRPFEPTPSVPRR
ncbi:MAG: TolC family protein [Rhodanobacteraceae bacterium]